jgi:hypothetical protein
MSWKLSKIGIFAALIASLGNLASAFRPKHRAEYHGGGHGHRTIRGKGAFSLPKCGTKLIKYRGRLWYVAPKAIV